MPPSFLDYEIEIQCRKLSDHSEGPTAGKGKTPLISILIALALFVLNHVPMNAKVRTLTCLFIGRGQCHETRKIEPPLAEEYQTPEVPPGMLHAVRVLGLSEQVRVFKRTVEGALPVYEELE